MANHPTSNKPLELRMPYSTETKKPNVEPNIVDYSVFPAQGFEVPVETSDKDVLDYLRLGARFGFFK